MVKNAVGREIPVETDDRKNIPFKGVGKHQPTGNKVGPPIPTGADYLNKLIKDLDQVLDRLNLFSGMTVSFHHHMRNGDVLVNLVLQKLDSRGIKDIVLAPSALFPVPQRRSLCRSTIHATAGCRSPVPPR